MQRKSWTLGLFFQDIGFKVMRVTNESSLNFEVSRKSQVTAVRFNSSSQSRVVAQLKQVTKISDHL